MNTADFLKNTLTVVDKTGKIINYEQELGLTATDFLYKHIKDNYSDVNPQYSDSVLYEMICKTDNIAFINFGKSIIDGVYKYDFSLLIPNDITINQKLILKSFLQIKSEYINSLVIYKYDKEKNKLLNLRYEEKLKYGIDNLIYYLMKI